MAAETRGATDSVAGHPPAPAPYGRDDGKPLFREGYRFDFFQAVRLLEQLFPEAPPPGTTSDVGRERIRFRPSTALAFPAADVKGVELLEEPYRHARVTATFMGLYGVDSPLPSFFYDRLATDVEETFPQRDFLDIFNHRLYAFFYRACKKYQPGVQDRPEERQAYVRRFVSLAGLGTPRAFEAAPVSPAALAAFAGRLIPRARNAEGLRALLSGMTGLPVAVAENVPRWVPMPQRPALGGGALCLGTTATIGRCVYDVAGKFQVRLGPMGLEDYLALLPSGPRAKTLHWLVRLYAPNHLDFDVALRLNTAEVPRLRLSDPRCKLGLTTCLGKPAQAVRTTVVNYEHA